jgi:hypothetical protein
MAQQALVILVLVAKAMLIMQVQVELHLETVQQTAVVAVVAQVICLALVHQSVEMADRESLFSNSQTQFQYQSVVD